jgi:hypothetical protein
MSWKTYEIQANMMMISEPAILMRGSSNPAGTNNSNPQPTDPTTLDYDAIDVFWRQDIEREKGIAPFNPMQYANDGQCCSTSGQMCSTSDVSEQFERDLQLLREKSLFTVGYLLRLRLDKVHKRNIGVFFPNKNNQTMCLVSLGHRTCKHNRLRVH